MTLSTCNDWLDVTIVTRDMLTELVTIISNDK